MNNDIIKTANNLLMKYGYSHPPIDPEYIAEEEGIDVKYVTFKDGAESIFHGFFDSEKKTIYVNKNDTVNEKVFTVAHELGHALLHKEYLTDGRYIPRLKNDHATENKEEREADEFACALIAPKHMLEKYKSFATENEMQTMFLTNHDVIHKVLGAK